MHSRGDSQFLVGLAAACLLGFFIPKLADFIAPLVVWLVAFIMFLVGLAHSPVDLGSALRNFRTLLLTLLLGFVAVPVLGFCLGTLFFADQPVLLAGIMIMTAVPTTVASSVVWTQTSGGNSALSVVLVVCSTMFGIFLLPLVLEVSLGRRIELPALAMIRDLVLVVALPVVIAQLLRLRFTRLRRLGGWAPQAGQFIILLLVLTSVARSRGYIDLELLLTIAAIALAVNSGVSLLTLGIAPIAGIGPRDLVAVLFASSQKTISVGLLVGLSYFEGLAGLPVLVYHLTQQITGYAWSRYLRGWLQEASSG